MYAVVETGGKQYKVSVGDKLKVEKLQAEEGASVGLGRVLMVTDGDNVTVGSPVVDVPVTATILSHGKGEKIRVFKMKRRKNYRRTQGHRQLFTEIEITGIGDQKASKKKASDQKATKSKKAPAKAKDESQVSAGSEAQKTESEGDTLTTINGIGPVIEKKLKALGVTTFKQIAEFDQAKIDEVNEQLSFKGRIEREEWVNQAKELIK